MTNNKKNNNREIKKRKQLLIKQHENTATPIGDSDNGLSDDAGDDTRTPQDVNAFLVWLPTEILGHIFSFLNTKQNVILSETCIRFYSIFNITKQITMHKTLYQAILDNNVKTVRMILEKNPALLLTALPNQERIIKSDLTQQTFAISEKPFELACKRRQLEIIRAMLPFFDKLAKRKIIENGASEALQQWHEREVSQEENDYYNMQLQTLINMIINEDFSHGSADALFERASDQTKSNLNALKKELSPEEPINLDDHFDFEMLLVVAKDLLETNYNQFQRSDQFNFYHQEVMHYIQKLAPTPIDIESLTVQIRGVRNLYDKKTNELRKLKTLLESGIVPENKSRCTII